MIAPSSCHAWHTGELSVHWTHQLNTTGRTYPYAVLLNEIQLRAAQASVRLRADFVSNDRNRVMYVTYRMGGFREVGRQGDNVVLESQGSDVPARPSYLTVRVVSGIGERTYASPP